MKIAAGNYSIKPDCQQQFAELVIEARDSIDMRRTKQGIDASLPHYQYIAYRLGLNENGRAFQRWYEKGKNRIKETSPVFWSFIYLALSEGGQSLEWLNKLLATLELYIPDNRRDYLSKAFKEYVALRPKDCDPDSAPIPMNQADPKQLEILFNELTWKSTYIRRYDPGYERLIGRTNEIATVLQSLGDSVGVPFIMLEAHGGMGKTAIAYDVMSQFIQGRILDAPYQHYVWVSAKYQILELSNQIRTVEDAARTIEDVINQILERLGLRSWQALRAQERLMRLGDYLKQTPCLICIDNLETLDDEISLLLKDISQYCIDERRKTRFLLTSRPTNLLASHLSKFEVHPLDEFNSSTLVCEYLTLHHKPHRCPTSEEMHAIYERVGGVPLVLRQLAVQLERFSTSTILKRLKSVKHSTDVRQLYDYIFLPTYQRLQESSQALLIFIAGSVAADGATYEYLQEQCQLGFAEFESALQELSYHHLLEIRNLNGEDRFALHSLTRSWVRQILLDLND